MGKLTDDLTFVIHWKAPFVTADQQGVGNIVRSTWSRRCTRDKQSLATTPLFSTEFIGLGPYKMVRWDQGSTLEAARFNDCCQGRPPLDTVIMRFVGNRTASSPGPSPAQWTRC